VSWDKRFDRPVILPDGKTLLTLEDARRHILALPKSDHETAAWQIAIEALVLAADVSRRGDWDRRRTLPAAMAREGTIKPAGVNRRAKCRSALLADSQIFRGRFAPVLHLFITHLGALIEVAQSGFFDGRDVHKNVFAAVVGLNKPKSLSRVEPLHSTCRHVRSPFSTNGPA